MIFYQHDHVIQQTCLCFTYLNELSCNNTTVFSIVFVPMVYPGKMNQAKACPKCTGTLSHTVQVEQVSSGDHSYAISSSTGNVHQELMNVVEGWILKCYGLRPCWHIVWILIYPSPVMCLNQRRHKIYLEIVAVLRIYKIFYVETPIDGKLSVAHLKPFTMDSKLFGIQERPVDVALLYGEESVLSTKRYKLSNLCNKANLLKDLAIYKYVRPKWLLLQPFEPCYMCRGGKLKHCRSCRWSKLSLLSIGSRGANWLALLWRLLLPPLDCLCASRHNVPMKKKGNFQL